jgi:hypothetical protein
MSVISSFFRVLFGIFVVGAIIGIIFSLGLFSDKNSANRVSAQKVISEKEQRISQLEKENNKLTDYNAFWGGHNLLNLLYQNRQIFRFRRYAMRFRRHICSAGPIRIPGLSVRKTFVPGIFPKSGASPKGVIISFRFHKSRIKRPHAFQFPIVKKSPRDCPRGLF